MKKDEEKSSNNEDETKGQDNPEFLADGDSLNDNLAEELEELEENWEQKYLALNDSYLRLMAEYDNYRKRTIREKIELTKDANEKTLTALLPVIDDFERAMANLKTATDLSAIVGGVELIFQKFEGFLSQQGVKMIEAIGKPFDTELFEAIATVPSQSKDQSGTVVDCVQTGFILNDKVIRHAKVVVGE